MKNNRFSKRLRELRVDRGLTQVTLAKALKVSQSSIAKWEKGDLEPNLETLGNIRTFFKVSMDYLLGFED